MPFYLGNLVPEFDDLYSTSYGIARDTDFFAARKGVRVLTGTKATAIDRECKRVRVVQLDSQQEYDLEYDYLVLTTGAEPISPSLSGLDTKVFFNNAPPARCQIFA
jgi:NADPH-dependent 2,4-dienoyl-CoA reductase/sulfur reductase-like enzyme